MRDRLMPSFDLVKTNVVDIRSELQRSAVNSAAFFTQNAGPIQPMLGRLDAPKQAALLKDLERKDLERLWVDDNLATDGETIRRSATSIWRLSP